MSGLTFPTRPSLTFRGYTPAPGTPRRAVPCSCERPLHVAGEDECVRCGHLKSSVIAATWQQRAREIASRGQRRRAKLGA